jgi:mono/diheme cytochrome c family protein
MKKHSSLRTARSCILLIGVLGALLVGCGSAPDTTSLEPVSAKAITDGNVDQGRDLFMGYAHFENEGPPCMGCHSVGENGLLGGGAMGPDLTNLSSQRSQTEILAVLSNTGRKISPVMRPIYTDHPLTWEEQVDLLAFLESSVGQPETDRELLVLGISLAGFVGAVGVLKFVYRNRLRSVRRALVNQSHKESR